MLLAPVALTLTDDLDTRTRHEDSEQNNQKFRHYFGGVRPRLLPTPMRYIKYMDCCRNRLAWKSKIAQCLSLEFTDTHWPT